MAEKFGTEGTTNFCQDEYNSLIRRFNNAVIVIFRAADPNKGLIRYFL